MKSLGLGTVEEFPFIDPPASKAIQDGYALLAELGAVDEANELTEIGKQLAKLPVDPRIGRMVLAAKSENALGEVLMGLRRFEEAVPHLREATEIFAQLEDRETESFLWQRLAMAHEHCGRPVDAHVLWERVHERCEGSGDPGGEALALEGIARCARQRGVRESAISIYERALSRARGPPRARAGGSGGTVRGSRSSGSDRSPSSPSPARP